MTLGGRYIRLPHLSARVGELRNRLSRARYFRGHGVHSPFVYSVVRQVFMSHRLLSAETSLRDALVAAGVPERRAMELQNLMTHCEYRTFAIDEASAELCVATRMRPKAETLRLVRTACGRGATIAVMEPYADRDRERMCGAIVAGHGSTTVDNRGYLLIFNNKYLPKQHFRI